MQLAGTPYTLSIPIGVSVDSSGDVWVLTMTNADQLWQFDSAGTCKAKYTLISGNTARGLMLDRAGNQAFALFSFIQPGTTTIQRFPLASRARDSCLHRSGMGAAGASVHAQTWSVPRVQASSRPSPQSTHAPCPLHRCPLQPPP